MPPDISVGAVGAAFIGALASLLGLVISKESKVSEFRQAWVDALRAEITAYLSNINAICDAVKVKYQNQGDKVAALAPHYSDLNTATFMISLRLNPEELEAKNILASMREFQELLSKEDDIKPELIRPLEAKLLRQSRILLKMEWQRVRDGEKSFRRAKRIAWLLLCATPFLIIYFSIQTGDTTKPTKSDAISAPGPHSGEESKVEAEKAGQERSNEP
ncbi:hypothetical protein [Alloyangia pacifica]|uniref:hypothetical protein n=1 Tax=Alloyangia pacifica TaxID=311180 RepID=UPI001CD53D6F|nr:hypothetical protein [Alloyangia pacifica]MCA0996847.1 hypothetical protein [Alloyangia pacifica]